MPIKKENKNKYPGDWPLITARIKKRSRGRCECIGECGLHDGRRCSEKNKTKAKNFRGTVILTTAHLNHIESDCRDENLKSMCQKCHLRFDMPHHKINSRKTRRLKKAMGDLFE